MLIVESEKKPVTPFAPVNAEGPNRPLQEEDPRWQLVERITESRSLGKSALLFDFRRYVSDRYLSGKSDEISEQQIGVKVFGRLEGYNCNDDNIVRSYARTLRKRLEEYFNNEGSEETMRLVIPRGGYIPVFSSCETPESLPESVDAPRSPLPLKAQAANETTAGLLLPATRRRSAGLLLSCLVILPALLTIAILGFLAGRSEAGRSLFASGASRISEKLWNSIFETNRDTFVVPADGGLVMMQSFSREKVGLPEYINGSYRSDSEITRRMQGLLADVAPADQATLTHKVSVLAARRYTSVVDLDLSTRFAQLQQVVPGRLLLRFSRDLRIDDLRDSDAILIGSSDANPWVSLFTNQMNFRFAQGNEFGGSGTILNTHPLAGEHERYASVTGDPSSRTYGILAHCTNLEGTGHVLLIEGVNMAGTQAAGDFLLQPKKMEPILRRALDKHGKLLPFEVLLETTSVGSNASRSEVLSERFRDDGRN